MPQDYDLIVIGSGSGLDVASSLAQVQGWKVAVIEKGPLGGTCLNRGCVPSKMVIHAADLMKEIEEAEKYGIEVEVKGVDFASITSWASNTVDEDARKIEMGIKEAENIDLYKLEAQFTAPKTLKVGNDEIKGERILIAAGARPFTPDIEGLDEVKYITSTEALRKTELPKRMIIIGGGYIAAELGHFYGTLGTDVTIIQRSEALLTGEDKDVSETFTKLFSKDHTVLLNHDTLRVREKDGMKEVVVKDKNSGEEKSLKADELLVATGINPNTDILKIENTDVEVDEKGYIKVNEYMETSEENVWALGDIVGIAPFKHAANEQAQVAYINISGAHGHKHAMNYDVMPHAIFSSPQIAAVGLTEQEAKEKGLDFEVRDYPYKNTAMGEALKEKYGFVKMIVNPENHQILGCHILGPEASTLIHEVIVAMTTTENSAAAIARSIHIHPALSEVVQRAA